MEKIYSQILNKAVSVLSAEEYEKLESTINSLDGMRNFGKPLDEKEKKMLENLKKAVSVDDIKILSNGKKDLKYFSWAQISKALTECLGKENWDATDLTADKVQKVVGGYLIHVTINLFNGKIVETMSLPVMDNANMPIKDEAYTYETRFSGKKTVEALDSFNLYKNYQRCFVKAVAVATGCGIELYTGEDLPENVNDAPQEATTEKQTNAKGVKGNGSNAKGKKRASENEEGGTSTGGAEDFDKSQFEGSYEDDCGF